MPELDEAPILEGIAYLDNLILKQEVAARDEFAQHRHRCRSKQEENRLWEEIMLRHDTRVMREQRNVMIKAVAEYRSLAAPAPMIIISTEAKP